MLANRRDCALVVVLALLLALTASGCGGSRAARTSTRQSDLDLPMASNFATVDLQGAPFRLSEQRGKVVLINFFATWCAPCVLELPHLRKLYELNKDKGFLLVIVSLNAADATADMRAFGVRNELNFPLIVDADMRISALFNPKNTAPLSILINRAGRIVVVHDGYTAGDEAQLAQDVASVLERGTVAAAK